MTNKELDKKLVVANWKSNGSFAENLALINQLLEAEKAKEFASDLVICPPFVYLQQVAQLLKGSQIKLGAQNISQFGFGAYTGEVSAQMLVDLGVDYVLVGHSERRSLFAETDAISAEKVNGALAFGITPILCLGESLDQRESGKAIEIVLKQLELGINKLSKSEVEKIVLAYEPIWAIGTGKTASAQEAEDMHEKLRSYLKSIDEDMAEKVKILYGGSLNETNVASLFKMPNIDGGLVGGASLDAQKFLFISSLGN